MIEIFPDLFCGTGDDASLLIEPYGTTPPDPWYIVSAAKFPWHRQALGYTGVAASKDDPEYLIALRPNRMILNLIDAPDPAYIREEIITGALLVIDEMLAGGHKILLHCNQGQSRAPTIGMLYLRRKGLLPDDFDTAADLFRKTYPAFAPGKGMELYARAHWSDPASTPLAQPEEKP